MSDWATFRDPQRPRFAPAGSISARLLSYLASVSNCTIGEAARQLDAPYETVKCALRRLVRHGHARSWRDPHDGRVVLYQYVEPACGESEPLEDDGWAPTPWRHPYRRAA